MLTLLLTSWHVNVIVNVWLKYVNVIVNVVSLTESTICRHHGSGGSQHGGGRGGAAVPSALWNANADATIGDLGQES